MERETGGRGNSKHVAGGSKGACPAECEDLVAQPRDHAGLLNSAVKYALCTGSFYSVIEYSPYAGWFYSV
ncbi:MAG: hypothetical protein ACKPKO_05005, partial [Candidatus Fonsibacter sp.]